MWFQHTSSYMLVMSTHEFLHVSHVFAKKKKATTAPDQIDEKHQDLVRELSFNIIVIPVPDISSNVTKHQEWAL